MDFEEVLNKLGAFGRFQKRLFAMVVLATIPNAFSVMMFAYTQYEPNFQCSLPKSLKLTKNSTEYEHLLNLTLPWEFDAYGVKRRSRCEMFDIDLENNTNLFITHRNKSLKVPCRYGHEFEDMNTAVAEFDMVCDDSWKSAFAITLYMIGMGLAAFPGCLSDRFGRRPVFLIFTFAQFLVTGALSLSWNYVSYITITLLVGFCGLANYVAAFVLVTEMMGIDRQLIVGVAVFGAATVGYIITPLLGFLFSNWRWYLKANFFIGIFYLPLLCYFPESLRWYMVSKNEKEAKILMAKIAKENGKIVDVDEIYERFQIFQESDEEKISLTNTMKQGTDAEESSYFLQCKNPTMRIRYITLCYSWFTTSLIYYAISLNPTHLSGHRLMNIFLSGIVEFPGLALSYFLPKYFGRVRSTALLYILCGVSCVIAPFLRKGNPVLVTILVLISKMAVTAAFNLIYVMTSEVSPTLVRNTSVGISSVCARIGGTAMPYVMLLVDSRTLTLPYVVMGVASALCGVTYLFFIPETGGILMPDSIDLAMKNKKIYGLNICKRFPSATEYDRKIEMHAVSVDRAT